MINQIKVELQEWLGTDKSIAEAAWTSSLTKQGKDKRTAEDVKRVVQMLANDGHSTPFESIVLRFWIKLPITADRQHVTHRIATHNGMSGRYRTMPDEWLQTPQDVLSIGEKAWSGQRYDLDYEHFCHAANNWYRKTLESLKDAEKAGNITNDEYKRAREFYRGVLPQNNMTERLTIMNLRSFANYQKLRNKPNAQPEIQDIARQMLEQVKLKDVAPVAIEWLEKNDWKI